MSVKHFLSEITALNAQGNATEHSYRPAIRDLINACDADINATNEPKREACGAPDFIIEKDAIAIGHIEAKDIGVDIRPKKGPNREQQVRYLNGLPNLIYTNGLDWDFYREGQLQASVTIGDYLMGVQARPENFDQLQNLLADFVAQRPQTITSAKQLAAMMAGKAVLIKDVLAKALIEDADLQSELAGQYHAFREHLIHDISTGEFADIYAETIAYGMFAARLHDPTSQDFTRQEALDLLPKSNPFLRSLFGYIAGPNLDDRIKWIIDDLADVFQACDLAALMANFGNLTKRNDPFIHFYEDFLQSYNPRKRKSRGVWYTPEPVVNFIVRAVDEVLKGEFGLADGLADTSKVTIDWDTGQTDKKGRPVTHKKEVHRVQILDPATGTGTFLAEVIKQIAPRIKGVAAGMWSGYIERDLIPRLHGFELLMASYAMCHMKLDMILTELGYKPTADAKRLSVYLTNSLEEGEREVRDLLVGLGRAITNEATEANTIKRDMPIMCVIGNPPYSGESANKGDWIMDKMQAYKMEPGGKVKLKERNPKWINDDYVKFIRFAESMIEKNGEGVLGFITNHGYLDNPTFRGMRWHLLKTFDKIYVLDLHGNSKKKEVSPDGSPDVNVFDIMQGVAIIIGVKKAGKNDGLAQVYHSDLWGKRAGKYQALWEGGIKATEWTRLELHKRYLMFYPVNHKLLDVYETGFSISDFMPLNQIGFQSHRDGFAVGFEKSVVEERLQNLITAKFTDEELSAQYGLKDNRDWQLSQQRLRIRRVGNGFDRVVQCDYRPFDRRYCMLDEAMMDYPRWSLLKNALAENNFAINFVRQTKSQSWQHAVVSRYPAPAVFVEIKDGSNFAPLYIYEDLDQSRRINFHPKLWKKLQKLAAHKKHGTPDEVQCFDYIYGVLHCPAYRDTYAEFLKIDFPRIPWPASPDEFWRISTKGGQLRALHLMKPDAIGDTPYPFIGDGDGVVDKPRFDAGRVWINESQYFDTAPELAWGFYIGGYQPAQKWLKDRKGRALSYDDIRHYQRILKILCETDRIMNSIDMDLNAPS